MNIESLIMHDKDLLKEITMSFEFNFLSPNVSVELVNHKTDSCPSNRIELPPEKIFEYEIEEISPQFIYDNFTLKIIDEIKKWILNKIFEKAEIVYFQFIDEPAIPIDKIVQNSESISSNCILLLSSNSFVTPTMEERFCNIISIRKDLSVRMNEAYIVDGFNLNLKVKVYPSTRLEADVLHCLCTIYIEVSEIKVGKVIKYISP